MKKSRDKVTVEKGERVGERERERQRERGMESPHITTLTPK